MTRNKTEIIYTDSEGKEHKFKTLTALYRSDKSCFSYPYMHRHRISKAIAAHGIYECHGVKVERVKV